MLKNFFYLFLFIFVLSSNYKLTADESEIPLCYIVPEVFDKNLVSYEEYIVEKCFDHYKDHIKKGAYLSKNDFLDKINKDEAFERFIYLYVYIKEYLHAQKGTIVDDGYALNFDDSIFRNYLIWGAQSGNYFGRLIASIEMFTYSVDEEILDSIKNNKHYLLATYDMGEVTPMDNMRVFFETYSLDDFSEHYAKNNYLDGRSEFEFIKGNKRDPEKFIYENRYVESNLPEGFISIRELGAFTESALMSLRINNYSKSLSYIQDGFDYLSLDPSNFLNILNNKTINPYYFDVNNAICDMMSYFFITDAYFDNNFIFTNELANIRELYSKCFVNEEKSKFYTEGEGIWWGLGAYWHGEYEHAYDLLYPSKLPRNYGGIFTKRNNIMTPAFFNYAALAALENNKIDEATEFVMHSSHALYEYDGSNNFQTIFLELIEIKLVYSTGHTVQAYRRLNSLRESILSDDFDLGEGYFIDEDIDIFINLFLDIAFNLKNINEDYFVDPLFLFELKNLVFQSDNLSTLRKNSDEGLYLSLLDSYDLLRDEKNYLENLILNSNNEEVFKLDKELKSIEKEILDVRTKILDLKKNLRTFYGASSSTHVDLQKRISDDDAILFYNFSISGNRTVVLTKDDIKLFKSSYGRNYVNSIIQKIRNSIEIDQTKLSSNLPEFDFVSSKKLYEILLSDLEISKFKNIYTFSNEILNSIPLQILVKSFDNKKDRLEKYLSADWSNKNHNFAIIETLFNKDKKNDYKRRFAGLGNPNLLNNSYFSEIPDTKQELIDLALASGGKISDLYMQDDVNYENFVNVVQSGSERLVIASHAFASASFPNTNESGIVLSGDEFNVNYITASEIAQLNINSDWVVLSACNTGFNIFNYSKNYSSLAKAFLAAGVNSVLVSNWSIETTTSSKITKDIFNNVWFDEDISKHEALKKASESLRKDLSNDYFIHPAFWGGYSIVYNSI